MTAYTGQTLTRTTLCQLCATLWDSQSQPVVIQPGIKLGSVVTPLALRCSALDRCATREPNTTPILLQHNWLAQHTHTLHFHVHTHTHTHTYTHTHTLSHTQTLSHTHLAGRSRMISYTWCLKLLCKQELCPWLINMIMTTGVLDTPSKK
jgi:hypothetical protein